VFTGSYPVCDEANISSPILTIICLIRMRYFRGIGGQRCALGIITKCAAAGGA
jgi:hypothetical protein